MSIAFDPVKSVNGTPERFERQALISTSLGRRTSRGRVTLWAVKLPLFNDTEDILIRSREKNVSATACVNLKRDVVYDYHTS